MLVLEEFLMSLWTKLVAITPGLIEAVILLILGLVVGKVLGKITREILVRLNVDKYVSARDTFIFKISDMFAMIVRWLIYLVFIQAASLALGIEAVAVFVNSVITFIPGLIGAAIVIIVGYVVASFLKDRILASKNVYSDLTSNIVMLLIMYISIATALPLVGIPTDLINWILIVIVGSLGLGFAIALGLGLKDAVAETSKKFVSKSRRK